MDDSYDSREQLILERKSHARRRMCWTALVSLVAYPIIIIGAAIFNLNNALEALTGIAAGYFVAIGAITSAYFGSEAFGKK